MPPARLKALLDEAVGHHNAGRLGAAAALYAQVLAASPSNFDAVHLSGLVAYQQGRHRDAVALLRRALRLSPGSSICEMRLGAALAGAGDHEAAKTHLVSSVRRSPGIPEAWCHLGCAQQTLGHVFDAKTSFERSVAIKPDFGEGWEKLGALLSGTEGFEAAVPPLRRALALRPGNATALANLGVALAQSGGQDEALRLLDDALGREPAHPLALTGRAFILLQTYRIPEAVAAYGAVLDRNPGNLEARSGRLLALHYLDGISREALFAEHGAFGAAVPRAAPARFPNTPDPARRLRIGFLSADLRAHSVAYFLEPILSRLDRSQFEVFLYHDHARMDGMSERLRSHCAAWRHVAGRLHGALEAIVRADAPDILVDLAGHTGHNRLCLFARRLAPVQVTYLGYPDTTGLREMDFRLVDAITDPVGEAARYHAETLVRFAPTAWSYAPPESAPAPAREPGDGTIVFGSFNNVSKVSDSTLRCWASVLAAVPGSRLLLKNHGLSTAPIASRLRERLAGFGIPAGRVDFAGRTPAVAAHLAAYGRMDIALDTFPYNGTTTTCEALWMGVPVVTLAGDRHASRVGASLLAAVGHPEWVAGDEDGYVAIASALAGDAASRAAARTGLRASLLGGPLMDHAGQAARFGAALRDMWEGWCERRTDEFAENDEIPLNSGNGVPMLPRNHDVPAVSA